MLLHSLDLGGEFSFSPAELLFTLQDGAQTVHFKARAGVTYSDAQGNRHTLVIHSQSDHPADPILDLPVSRGWNIVKSDERVHLAWHISESGSLHLTVANTSHEELSLEQLEVLAIEPEKGGRYDFGLGDLRFFQHGWQSWSPTRVVRLTDPLHPQEGDEEYHWKNSPHLSQAGIVDGEWGKWEAEWFSLLGNAEHALLFGFVTAARQLSEIRLERQEGRLSLTATCHADGAPLPPGATTGSERLLIGLGRPADLVERYAQELGTGMQARLPTRLQAPTGWCTWYYYYGENTQAEIEANLDAIRAHRLPLEWVLIDDGYQKAIGDWTDIRPDKFPAGMRAAADEIRKRGFVPGIWLAPFGARHDSYLAREHPEYLLRDARGEPVMAWRHWYEDIFALDPTHPGVQEFLHSLFKTLSDDWGFEIFKLDFIFAGARPGVHHDRSVTRVQAYRAGLECIRSAVGDKFILGCGAPLAPSVGLVDAMRVGSDVAVTWQAMGGSLSEPSLWNALRNTLLRWAFHARLWLNDADCVLVRGRQGGSLITKNEVRTLASVVALSGGLVLNSDNLALLGTDRLRILRQILPPTNLAARPLDFFSGELPSQFELQIPAAAGQPSWKILAGINWESRRAPLEIPLGDSRVYHVYEFWTRRYLGLVDGAVTLPALGPHATALLVCKPVASEPTVLATTFHFAGGLVDVPEVSYSAPESCKFRLCKVGRARGQVILALPPNSQISRLRVRGRSTRWTTLASDIIAFGLTLDGEAQVELELEPRG